MLYDFSWEDAQKWPSTSDRVLAADWKPTLPRLPWWVHELISYLQEHRWLRQLHHPRVHARMGVMGVRQLRKSASFEFCVQFAGTFKKVSLIHSQLFAAHMSDRKCLVGELPEFFWTSLTSLASPSSSRECLWGSSCSTVQKKGDTFVFALVTLGLFLGELFSERNSVAIFYCRVLPA